MKGLSVILSLLLLSNSHVSYAQNIDEITLYGDITDGSKKSYCVTVDTDANIKILESTTGSCRNKSIDYRVQVQVQKTTSKNPATNRLLKKETFYDPVFISKLTGQAIYIISQYLTGNLKPEKI